MGKQLFSITKNNIKNFVIAFLLLTIFLIFIFAIGLSNHFYFDNYHQYISLIFFGLSNGRVQKPELHQIWAGMGLFNQQPTTSHIYSAVIMILTLLTINFIATFAVLFAPTNYGVISFVVDFFSKIALILVIILSIVILVQFHNFTVFYKNQIENVSSASISTVTLIIMIIFGNILPALDVIISLSKRIMW